MTTSEAVPSCVIFGGPFWPQDLPKLLPGAHVAVISTLGEADIDGIEGRKSGLELRDTLLVLGPGEERPTASYVLLFRKSLAQSTVAEQILSTATGALHIAACRVASDMSEFFSKTTGKPRSGAGHAKGYGMEGVFGGDRANPPHEKGRWPPNVLIVHSTGCRRLGTKSARATSIHGETTATRRTGVHSEAGGHQTIGRLQPVTGYAKSDGTEDVPDWQCSQNCPAPRLDGLSGITTSRVGQPRSSTVPGRGWGMTKTGAEYSDSGGASRFYPQFENENAMIAWLSDLISPGVHEVT